MPIETHLGLLTGSVLTREASKPQVSSSRFKPKSFVLGPQPMLTALTSDFEPFRRRQELRSV